MRIVDLQMSVGGSAPAGSHVGAYQAIQNYRFFKDVDHARRENLHRQESVVTSMPATSSLIAQDVISVPSRTYVNRARREDRDHEGENRKPQAGRYAPFASRGVALPTGQEIDFLA